jgi:hypothetical protein
MSSTTPSAGLPQLPALFRLASSAPSMLRRVLIVVVAAASAGAAYGTGARVLMRYLPRSAPEVLVPAAVVAGVAVSVFWSAPFLYRGAKAGHLLLTGSLAGILFPMIWVVMVAAATGTAPLPASSIFPARWLHQPVLAQFCLGGAASAIGLAVAMALLPLFTSSARLRDSASIEYLVVTLRGATVTLLVTGIASLAVTYSSEGLFSPSMLLVVAAGLVFALSLRLSAARAKWRGWLARDPSMLTRFDASVQVDGACVLDARPTHALLERVASPYRRPLTARLLVRLGPPDGHGDRRADDTRKYLPAPTRVLGPLVSVQRWSHGVGLLRTYLRIAGAAH